MSGRPLTAGLDKVRARESCEPLQWENLNNTSVSLNSCPVNLNSTSIRLQLALWHEVSLHLGLRISGSNGSYGSRIMRDIPASLHKTPVSL